MTILYILIIIIKNSTLWGQRILRQFLLSFFFFFYVSNGLFFYCSFVSSGNCIFVEELGLSSIFNLQACTGFSGSLSNPQREPHGWSNESVEWIFKCLIKFFFVLKREDVSYVATLWHLYLSRTIHTNHCGEVKWPELNMT